MSTSVNPARNGDPCTTLPELVAELGSDPALADRLLAGLVSGVKADALHLLGASVFGSDHRWVARVLLRAALAELDAPHTTPRLGDHLVHPRPTVAPQPDRVVTEVAPSGAWAVAREVDRPGFCVLLKPNEHGAWYVCDDGSDVLFGDRPTTPPPVGDPAPVPVPDPDELVPGWTVKVSYEDGACNPYVAQLADVLEVVARLTGRTPGEVEDLVEEVDEVYGVWTVPLTRAQVAELAAGGPRELVSQLGDALAYVEVEEP